MPIVWTGRNTAEEKLQNAGSREVYPEIFRFVKAVVKVNGKEKIMIFITNNLEWSANSVCDLNKWR
ncbi:MAG TPA: hypothetical protein DC049_18845 [Spirochaetia bacterium]|nr:hypothetical protein [Spirochaetia bacterium]